MHAQVEPGLDPEAIPTSTQCSAQPVVTIFVASETHETVRGQSEPLVVGSERYLEVSDRQVASGAGGEVENLDVSRKWRGVLSREKRCPIELHPQANIVPPQFLPQRYPDTALDDRPELAGDPTGASTEAEARTRSDGEGGRGDQA
jgi:hypothetical protein